MSAIEQQQRAEPDPYPSPIATHGPVGWSRTFSSLTNRNFRIFWIGMLFSFTGMQLGMVARQWLTYELTDSSTYLGIVGALTAVPMLVFSLLGGVVADRSVKRNLLVLTQAGTGVVAFALAFLILWEWIAVWHVMAAALLTGFIFSFNAPGRQALISELVEPHQLMNAISLNSAGMNLTRIIAPVCGGLLVAAVGLAWTYYIYALQYLLAVAMLLMLPAGIVARQRQATMREDLAEGIAYVTGNRDILVLMVSATVPIIFAMPYQVLMPIMVDLLEGGPQAFGLMMGAVGVGALLGSLAVASLGDFKYKGVLMLLAGTMFGVSLVAFALTRNFALSLAVLTVLGAASTTYMSTNNVLVQMLVPDEVRGRIMGIYMLTWGLSPLGSLPAGMLGDLIGVPAVLAIGGVVTALSALATLVWFPSIRRL